jgi:anti-sigma-K factor RskA
VSDELDRELKESLQRVPAPEGFADRVMERVAGQQNRVLVMPWRRSQVWQAVIAAVALIAVMSGATAFEQRRQERLRAELLQQQFDVAMRVTGRTLDGVGERISRAGMKDQKEN